MGMETGPEPVRSARTASRAATVAAPPMRTTGPEDRGRLRLQRPEFIQAFDFAENRPIASSRDRSTLHAHPAPLR